MPKAKARCHIVAGELGAKHQFPLSRSGWTAAHREAIRARDAYGAGYATLTCGRASIPLYQCYLGEGCVIEGSAGSDLLAGAKPRKRRR